MEATAPLLVPHEAPHTIETLEDLRTVLLGEDDGRLVVLECYAEAQSSAGSPFSDDEERAVAPSRQAQPLDLSQHASLASAFPSLSIHRVLLTPQHGNALSRALRFTLAPRWIVCSPGFESRVLERAQCKDENDVHAFLTRLVRSPPPRASGRRTDLRPVRWWRAEDTACDCIVCERWGCYCRLGLVELALLVTAVFFVWRLWLEPEARPWR